MTTTGKGSRPASALKTLLAGAALTAALGFTLSAQASHIVDSSDCTTNNWSSAEGLTADDAGVQGATNRRYGGPCGLRVSVTDEAYLVSDHPNNESTYNVRFYAFLDNAGGDIMLFQALDGADAEVFSVWFNDGAVSLMAAGDVATFDNLESGWHSIHVNWESAASANIEFLVANRNTPDGSEMVISGDTSGNSISSARLGSVNGVAGSGSLDFDDFVSTRITPPDRLLVGDSNNDEAYSIGDVTTNLIEFNGGAFADGQPDCNEDGDMSIGDVTCTLIIFNSL